MSLDENGNVRSAGWGKSIADAISAFAGNPKADAEAEAFRTTSAFNKLKLDDAQRASQRDKDLDAARAGWKSLTEDTEIEDPSGEIEVLPDGLGVKPKRIKKEAAFKWDPDGMHFKFDQERVGDFLKYGTALYGPDFFTKWHPFLTRVAPDYAGKLKATGAEANVLSSLGFAGHPSAMPLSESTKNNMIDRSIAAQVAQGRGEAARIKDTGVTTDVEGNQIVGPNHPSNAGPAEWDGPKEGVLTDQDGNPYAMLDSNPEPNQDPEQDLTPPDVGPVVPRQEPVYKSDLAAQVSGKRPSIAPGTVPEILPDGRKLYRPPQREVVSGPTPQEQKIDWQNTNKQSNYASAEAKVAAQRDHGSWVATLPKSIAAFMANAKGDVPGATSTLFGAGTDPANNPYVNSIATWIAGVEQKLEVAGFSPIVARQLALQKAAELYRGKYDTDWEMIGPNRAKLKSTDTLVSPDEITQSFDSNWKQQIGDLPSKNLFADNYLKSALVQYGLDDDDRKLEGLQESDRRLIQKHAIHIGFLRDILRKVRTNGGRYLEESEVDGVPIEKRMTESNLSQTEKSLAEHEAYLDALLRKHRIVEK